MAAYAFARLRFRGRSTLFALYLGTLIIPSQVTLIPNYLIVRELHWHNTYAGLIAPFVVSVFSTFLLRQFFLAIPSDYEDAARIDGANSFGVLRRVLVPQAVPAVMTMSVLVFTYTWNEFLLALVLVSGSQSHQTAPLGLSFFAGANRAGDPTKVAAAAVLVAAPILLVYLFLQRHFVRGMLAGALKE
jgi:raffinose/stachyose/melibiose transport system permease protein